MLTYICHRALTGTARILDLGPDHVSLAVLQHRVDLNLVFAAVVEELGALP
jgi:hypothetical protein